MKKSLILISLFTLHAPVISATTEPLSSLFSEDSENVVLERLSFEPELVSLGLSQMTEQDQASLDVPPAIHDSLDAFTDLKTFHVRDVFADSQMILPDSAFQKSDSEYSIRLSSVTNAMLLAACEKISHSEYGPLFLDIQSSDAHRADALDKLVKQVLNAALFRSEEDIQTNFTIEPESADEVRIHVLGAKL